LHEFTSAPDLEMMAVLPGHEDVITEVVVVGSEIYTASKDGTVKVWDSVNAECTRSVPVGGEAHSMLIEAPFLIVGVKDANDQGLVKIWNMQSGVEQELAGHQGEVRNTSSKLSTSTAS
jgi:WD40 repeat protein